MAGTTPPAEFDVSEELVRGLLKSQCPQFADRSVRFHSSGWDNWIFRIGEDLSARLPRRQVAVARIEAEQRWLPTFAELIPVAVPEIIHLGAADSSYPWPWSLVRWVSGEPFSEDLAVDARQLQIDLAAVLNAVHAPADVAAPENASRGVPLRDRDEQTHNYIRQIKEFDPVLLRKIWSELSRQPAWTGPPLWLHGDLHPLNLLFKNRRLSGVIDFGDVTSGDPATDFAVAWMLFDSAEREQFRAELNLGDQPTDQATWNRARGWALSIGAALLTHSADAPAHYAIGRHTIRRVLDSL